jgi:hypothetical protein
LSLLQVNGGRPCNTYRGKPLPDGLTVCGDHMATATLNGAIESGVNAGKEAVKVAMKAKKPPVASGDAKKENGSSAKKEPKAAEKATA